MVVISHEFAATLLSARLARQATRQALAGCAETTIDVAELLVAELVTNVVRHAESGVVVHIEPDCDQVRVSVEDQSPALPRVQPFRVDAIGGRGLQIVAGMASSWGVQARAGGKAVWFELTDK